MKKTKAKTLKEYIPVARAPFRANRDQKGVRSALKAIALSPLGDMQINEITRSDIASWVDELVIEDLSDGRINHFLAKLNKVMVHADERGLLPAGRPKYQHTRHSRRREYELMPDVEHDLMRCLRRYGREHEQFATVLLYTGARYSEVTSLPWSEWHNDTVTFKLTKSGKPRTIPLYRPARDALIEAHGQRPHKPGPFDIFRRHRDFRKSWDAAREDLGLAAEQDFTPHCLRHTCITRLVRTGMPLMKVKEWGGWSSLVMVQRYSHLEAARDLRDATKHYAIDNVGSII
jgi:integrase